MRSMGDVTPVVRHCQGCWPGECPECAGKLIACNTCNGSGTIYAGGIITQTCPTCEGTGTVLDPDAS